MSSVRLDKSSILKVVADLLAHHCEQATFNFGPDGLKIQSLDSCHVALLELIFHDKFFAEYKCLEDTRLGVNLQALSRALSMFASKQPLKIAFERSAEQLVLSQDAEDCSRDFELKLCAAVGADQMIEIPAPERGFAATLNVAAADFLHACQHANSFGDTVTISAGPPVTFNASDFDVDTTILCAPRSAEIQAKTRASYPVKYMMNFARACAGFADAAVSLSFNDQEPLHALCELPNSAGRLRLCLAARN